MQLTPLQVLSCPLHPLAPGQRWGAHRWAIPLEHLQVACPELWTPTGILQGGMLLRAFASLPRGSGLKILTSGMARPCCLPWFPALLGTSCMCPSSMPASEAGQETWLVETHEALP